MAKTNTDRKLYLLLPFKYGVVGGLFAVALFLVLILSGANPLLSTPVDFLVNLIILLIFVIFSIKEFKNIHHGGYLHFWQGMSIGVFTVTVIALISSVFILLYLNWFDPTLLDGYKSSMEALINSNKSAFVEQYGEAVYSKTLADNSEVRPIDLAMDEFLKKKVFIGFFVTLIVSVIMRRNPVTVNK